MAQTIAHLHPEILWKHFFNLTQIPRPSGHEAAVIDYIKQFAIQQKLEYVIDKAGNIIVRKPSSNTRKGAKGVVLQAHVDMVPQKNSDKKHDFLTDPIETIIDGDWVKANKTTLGADNGIGAAAALAILESDSINHGPIEALFTVSEETGMDGAFGLEKGILKSDILMNLDSEEEGEIYIGCAGGVNVNIDYEYREIKQIGGLAYKIHISGLKGGHSGLDINLGRANANMLMAELLTLLQSKHNVQLSEWQGGNLRNAIPREAESILVVDQKGVSSFKESITRWTKEINTKYVGIEDEILISVEESKSVDSVMETDSQLKIVELLRSCLNGVIKMSDVIPGIVQTSNNLSIVKIGKGKGEVKMLLRSSVDIDRATSGKQIEKHFDAIGATTILTGDYPGWQPNAKSLALSQAKDTYKKIFGKLPEVKVIHAGLECGIIGGSHPKLDMISFGPTIQHPHSPDERVNIASVGKFWDFIKGMLEAIS
jgi:dipeptidase D